MLENPLCKIENTYNMAHESKAKKKCLMYTHTHTHISHILFDVIRSSQKALFAYSFRENREKHKVKVLQCNLLAKAYYKSSRVFIVSVWKYSDYLYNLRFTSCCASFIFIKDFIKDEDSNPYLCAYIATRKGPTFSFVFQSIFACMLN